MREFVSVSRNSTDDARAVIIESTDMVDDGIETSISECQSSPCEIWDHRRECRRVIDSVLQRTRNLNGMLCRAEKLPCKCTGAAPRVCGWFGQGFNGCAERVN
jgi:hypothetical protein